MAGEVIEVSEVSEAGLNEVIKVSEAGEVGWVRLLR